MAHGGYLTKRQVADLTDDILALRKQMGRAIAWLKVLFSRPKQDRISVADDMGESKSPSAPPPARH